MTQPLALLLYEKLLPGTQLVNRLQDMGYRVQTVAGPNALLDHATRETPMCVLIDLLPSVQAMCEAIISLKKNPPTSHIPVIAFTARDDPFVRDAASQAGADLVVTDAAISLHLKELLERALTQL